MIKQRLILVTTLLCFFAFAKAQSVDQHVIGSAGGVDQSDKYILEWTTGEMSVKTVDHSVGIHTEGFHQTSLIVTEEKTVKQVPELNITIAPNPVKTILSVQINSDIDSRLELLLMDLNGKKISSTLASSKLDSKDLDMTELHAGVYLLHVFNSSGAIIKTFKISKVN